jgi:hypothetical protein
MKCPKCGTEVVAGEKACWQCFTPLQAPGAAQPQAPAAPRRVGRARKPWIPFAAAVVVLAAAAAGLYYWRQSTGPAACARAYCAAVEKNDAQAITKLMSAKDRRGIFGRMASMTPPGGGGRGGPKVKAVVKQVSQTGNTARAEIHVSMGTGRRSAEMAQPLLMVKETDGWRIDMEATFKEQLRAMGISPETLEGFPSQPPAPTR